MLFKINGREYEEGHIYTDEKKQQFMVVRASRW
jgi:hypothetical protein